VIGHIDPVYKIAIDIDKETKLINSDFHNVESAMTQVNGLLDKNSYTSIIGQRRIRIIRMETVYDSGSLSD